MEAGALLARPMDFVEDGVGDAIGERLHPVREVGGEEHFGIAGRGHASCSWSRMVVRSSASSAARMAAVAYDSRDFAVPRGMPKWSATSGTVSPREYRKTRI